jgi:adenylate kinase
MKLILVGPPGSGKGTMSRLLRERYKITSFAVGDVLRAEIKKGSELGKLAASYIDKGNFVPNEVSGGIVKNKLRELGDNYVLDGYPRNIPQAETLKEIMKDLNTGINIVFHLDIEDEALKERLKGRIVCPKCGFTYHTVNLKPKKEGLCDHCDVPLERRKDDDFIDTRLEIYYRETAPLIHYYKDKIVTIYSNCSIEEQFASISDALKKKGLL